MRALALGLLLMIGGAAQAALPVEPARVLHEYPHDPAAFTEGLLIRDGWLYESTGYAGSISRKELATGKTVQSVATPPDLFGEGIVDWGGKIYSFVWKGGKGFVWDLKSFRRTGSWSYTGEGWSLTQDGRHIIMSDGTSTLRFLDPKTMTVVRRLPVTAEGKPLAMINELEYVHGEILANVWMTGAIVRIDPADGHVKGVIDVSALWRQVGTTSQDAVPNGIAYDKKANRLFVTGKNWPTLFEIALPGTR